MEDNYESKSNISLHRLQAKELQYYKEQEERSWSFRVHQVLQILQKTHCSQRNKITSEITAFDM